MTDLSLNPVTPVTNGALVTSSNPLPVYVTGGSGTLGATTFTGNVTPNATNTLTLGSASLAWSSVYSRMLVSDGRLDILANATTLTIGVATGLTGNFQVNGANVLTFAAAGVTIPVDRGLLFTNQTSGAGAQTGTLTNAPTVGNPGHWLKIAVGGVSYSIPCWAG